MTKRRGLVRWGFFRRGRVVERPVLDVSCAGQCRTRLERVVAYANDKIECSPDELDLCPLARSCRDVDAGFAHRACGDRGPRARRPETRRVDLPRAAAQLAPPSFSHPAATRISDTQEQHALLQIGLSSESSSRRHRRAPSHAWKGGTASTCRRGARRPARPAANRPGVERSWAPSRPGRGTGRTRTRTPRPQSGGRGCAAAADRRTRERHAVY